MVGPGLRVLQDDDRANPSPVSPAEDKTDKSE
jgi:hypothetical protein